jgi:apolipoprotein D and lipocalin family protein
MKWIMLLVTVMLAAGCTEHAIRKSTEPLTAVPQLDLARYAGKWFEIASRPNRFQKGCVATTATYTLAADGTVNVLNECRDQTLDGKIRSATGKAWLVDDTHAKLKVSFFWPFRGDYWVLELGKNYEYTVIGEPAGRYVWILSRERKMDPAVFQGILDRLKSRGYSVEAITKTLQPES